MNNKSYRQDESLVEPDLTQVQQIDQDPFLQEEILPSENQEIDVLEETQNITFNFTNIKTFMIEIPDFAKLFSLQRYYYQELKQFLTSLELNFQIVKEGLKIQTEVEDEHHEGIQNEINKYLKIIYTKKLALDYDSSRTFFRSNYIQKECQQQQYFIVKQKNYDQKIEIHLVSKNESIGVVASNLEQKLKGLRIFFQDVVNHMTTPKVNIDHKTLLGTLRQVYFQKIISDDLEKQLPNIEFVDVIDKKKTFSSAILGLHFPFDLQGKSLLCQEIFQYIKKRIESLLVIFISFEIQVDYLNQARKIENQINNFKQETRFLCVCQVDQSLKVIAILGTPESIKIIFNEQLKQREKEFSKEFFKTFKVNILQKNFDFNSTQQMGTFQSQIVEFVKKKKEIEILSQEQLYSLKFITKVSFESYCTYFNQLGNLITFICDKKIGQATEKALSEDLKKINSKIKDFNLNGKFFTQLEKIPDRIKNMNIAVQQNQEQARNQNQNQKQQQKVIEKPIPQQNLPQVQNPIIQQNQKQQQIIKITDSKDEQQEQLVDLFVGKHQHYENVKEEKIVFKDFIVQEILDGNGKIKISEEYDKHFKKLTNNNQNVEVGHISITEKHLMSLKAFDKEIKIYPKVNYIQRQLDEIILLVWVNGNADKNKDAENMEIFGQINKQDEFYMVNQDNQILPIHKIQK
ncbi:unnamed protein product (macronuclear) [Paramecium tetraurelia]|uniref:Uncharacterized protein n=1 Tax=Paramecium tetraurelia TaxID=5888 RepID=A0DQQ7_PARTE|nr:uncharacterized protein GSPATT00002774001 [Paramecium tetraurelia]CAK85374.1 unnamed protein product [Paramecium tetraurelia]|eukprot:XP_001452771.1 hypothetical protein (macronuclear) [Paramecium tetraurelia strain d4-2]